MEKQISNLHQSQPQPQQYFGSISTFSKQVNYSSCPQDIYELNIDSHSTVDSAQASTSSSLQQSENYLFEDLIDDFQKTEKSKSALKSQRYRAKQDQLKKMLLKESYDMCNEILLVQHLPEFQILIKEVTNKMDQFELYFFQNKSHTGSRGKYLTNKEYKKNPEILKTLRNEKSRLNNKKSRVTVKQKMDSLKQLNSFLKSKFQIVKDSIPVKEEAYTYSNENSQDYIQQNTQQMQYENTFSFHLSNF